MLCHCEETATAVEQAWKWGQSVSGTKDRSPPTRRPDRKHKTDEEPGAVHPAAPAAGLSDKKNSEPGRNISRQQGWSCQGEVDLLSASCSHWLFAGKPGWKQTGSSIWLMSKYLNRCHFTLCVCVCVVLCRTRTDHIWLRVMSCFILIGEACFSDLVTIWHRPAINRKRRGVTAESRTHDWYLLPIAVTN